MENRKFASKKDIIIIIAVLAVALIGIVIYNVRYKTPKATPSPSSTTSSTDTSSSLASSQNTNTNEIDESIYAEVFSNNELIYSIGLEESQIIDIPDKDVQIEIKDNSIGFIHSDCPDQICVHTGFINSPGYVSACLPNGVVVVIAVNEEPSSSSAIDTTA